MSSRLETLRERRLAMVATCEQDRIDLSDAFAGVQRELHVADRLVAVAQRLSRHKAILGVMAAGLVLAPVMARKWIRRASWWLPIAIQGYRIIQSSRRERRTRRRDSPSTAE
ncbi:MAG TPA: hypothetical protein VJS69_04810 [Candidatus Krumholzibacteria bacterium]|nr:hypothetical protein [Candidatus Krumholzibacteria bacterium]